MKRKIMASAAVALGMSAMIPFASLDAAGQYAIGDVNKDGSLTKDDATRIIQIVQGTNVPVDEYILADYNQDNTVEYKDAYELMRDIDSTYILGDADKNGKLSLDDNEVIKNVIMANEGPSTKPEDVLYMDVNMDGKVTSADYVTLKNGLTGATDFFDNGDVTLDRRLTKDDAIRIIEIYKGATATNLEKKYADYNKDGVVNIKDAQDLMSAIDPTYKLGDADKDGIITQYDTVLALRTFSGTSAFASEEEALLYVDMDQNGTLELTDVVSLLRKVEYAIGDVNLDGELDRADALRIVEIACGAEAEPVEVSQADYNKDDEVTIRDAHKLLTDYDENFMVGDANHNGMIDYNDWEIYYTIVNETYTYGTQAETVLDLDMNEDGKVNAKDWCLVYEIIYKNKGDVNEDGVINVEDAGYILDVYKGIIPQTEKILFLGDVNKDGVLNVEDAGAVLDKFKGIIK